MVDLFVLRLDRRSVTVNSSPREVVIHSFHHYQFTTRLMPKKVQRLYLFEDSLDPSVGP